MNQFTSLKRVQGQEHSQTFSKFHVVESKKARLVSLLTECQSSLAFFRVKGEGGDDRPFRNRRLRTLGQS